MVRIGNIEWRSRVRAVEWMCRIRSVQWYDRVCTVEGAIMRREAVAVIGRWSAMKFEDFPHRMFVLVRMRVGVVVVERLTTIEPRAGVCSIIMRICPVEWVAAICAMTMVLSGTLAVMLSHIANTVVMRP